MLKKDYSQKRFVRTTVKTKLKKKKSRAQKYKKLIATSVAVFVLGLVVYGGVFSRLFIIEQFRLEGTDNPEIYQRITYWLEQQAGIMKLKIIPGNHLFLLSTKDLKDQLLERKYIKQVNIRRVIPSSLNIYITERKANIVYLKENRFYLLDENGSVIEGLGLENTRIDLPLVIGTTTNEHLLESIGNVFADHSLSKKNIQFIYKLSTEFPKYFDKVTLNRFQPILKASEVRADTSAGWYILFDQEKDLLVQLSNLSRVYEEKISEEEKQNLEYIDVRLENYVYYK